MKCNLGDTWKCECGTEHRLGEAYVAAHWYLSLNFTCPKCNRTYEIKEGNIIKK